MKRYILVAMFLAAGFSSNAQEDAIAPGENLVVEGVPKISASLAETVGRYTENREAFQTDWHPTRREMIIGTRFGNTYQAHLVAMPQGARRQLTFFPEPVYGGSFHPKGADYVLYTKDVGGGEWYQFFRYDLATGESTLLTDGKSRNTSERWSMGGDRIAYVSTRRNNQDTDLWVMDPSDRKTDHMLLQLSGGGWEPQGWSPDDKKILLMEGISVNETYLWLVDATTGEKIELTPRKTDVQVAYGSARFSRDGKGVYVTTDKDSQFQRLAYIDLSTKKMEVLTPDLSWDVDEFAQSWDGKWLAYLSNEDGISKLHLIDAVTRKEQPVPTLPVGVIGGLIWHRNNRDLGFGMTTAKDPGDCYSLDVSAGKVERWTTSETAVNTSGLHDAELVRWKTFDGRTTTWDLAFQLEISFTMS